MAFDFAIFGSTPSAMLLAGLLATEHGKSVCVIGEAWSPWLLPRRLDAAWMPATRPETWAMLKAGTAETSRLLAGLGKGLVEPVDPLLIAETPASLEAIAHFRATVQGHGQSIERVADRSLVEPASAYLLRSIAALVPGVAEPSISQWLDRSGARRWRPGDGSIAIRRDGSVRIKSFGREFDAAQAVLVDDAAILDRLDAETRGRHFVDVPTHTVLTEPTRPLAAPLVAYLDRRVWLSQRGRNCMLATATGSEAVEARIGSTLGPQSGLRRAAAARHTRLETHDGAPLVGFARGSKTIVLAGFGDAAIFFTPAIARHLAGAPSAAEADYFAARDVGRGNARQLVADFVPEPV